MQINNLRKCRVMTGTVFFVSMVVILVLLGAVTCVAQPTTIEPMYEEIIRQSATSTPTSSFWGASRWPPYLVGVGIGLLAILSFLVSDTALGVSSAYSRSAGMIERLVRGQKAVEKEYYQEHPPTVDWEWMLLIGVVLGAVLSAVISGDFHWEWVPPLWEARFGPGVLMRLLAALAGGFCIGLGARWARGCTSGHGISGTLQLVVSSWVAVLCFFVGGIIVAFMMY